MLYGFGGYKGSGKDTAASVLVAEYGFTRFAFADKVKDLLLAVNPVIYTVDSGRPVRLRTIVDGVGWDAAKRLHSEVRRSLQAIATEGCRDLFGADFWVNQLANQRDNWSDPDSRYVISDVRFDNEIDFIKDNGGTLIWVYRPDTASDGHLSESDAVLEQADYVLRNDEKITDLQEDVRFMAFMHDVSSPE